MNTATEPSLLLLNARVVLDNQLIERGSLLIKSGVITNIFAGEPARSPAGAGGAVEWDLAGATLFPGFIDVHIHGAMGFDTLESSPDDLDRVSRFLASRGVTAWLPTLVPASLDQYQQAIDSVSTLMNEQRRDWDSVVNGRSPERGEPARPGAAARVLGVHYEGPFVNEAQCGALQVEHFRTYSGEADVAALPTPTPAGAIRMITVAPEINGGVALVRELTKQGWLVSLGHTRAPLAVLEAAHEAGAHHLTHFMNAMAPLHHRAPGPIGWGLSRDDVTCDIIADGIHLDTAILRLLLKLKSSERLVLISDAIAAAGLGAGNYQIWGETISVSAGRTQNARGAIAGSVITMLEAVRMMLNLGASAPEVARMAATNPARLLGIDNECGSIAVGKRADLVALDQDGSVRSTFVGGTMFRS